MADGSQGVLLRSPDFSKMADGDADCPNKRGQLLTFLTGPEVQEYARVNYEYSGDTSGPKKRFRSR